MHNNKGILLSKSGRGGPRINENISSDSPNSSALSFDESCSKSRKLANIKKVPDDARLDSYCQWPLHDSKHPHCVLCKAKSHTSVVDT